ncbi:MAG: SpoIIE family protein phosphatase [Lachnospiraceae bacterium]|nr:SpoIIE family protein phosphatase [Lachnospiraceae bacterium]
MFKKSKQSMATLGLIFITFLAAVQYIFLRNIPENVSTFSFIFITNVIGLTVFFLVNPKKVLSISKSTVRTGLIFAVELSGFNFFAILGSRHLDAVIISSVISLYFAFVTPILLLLKKKVNFFSGIATVIATIALLLMFGADTDSIFASSDVIYLIIADIFFAAYVVSVSILGEKEDSYQLTCSQMLCSAVLAFVGWIIESCMGRGSFSFPTDVSFWVSAVFIGLCIRAVYGLLQISCQKYVSALFASLIFASEIIITLIMNPLMCRLFDMEYTPATAYQIIGAILFILATLMIDNKVMSSFGYEDLPETTHTDSAGNEVRRSSVAQKMVFTTLMFALFTMVVCTVTCLVAISVIRTSAVSSSQKLGQEASNTSSTALTDQLEENISAQARDKVMLAETKLDDYANDIAYAASYASSLYANKAEYPKREVQSPEMKNAGIWTMQRTLADEKIDYQTVRESCELLGNMQDIFVPITQNHNNIATIYIGTKDGLMVSYDTDSDSAVGIFYEFRQSSWYKTGSMENRVSFTDAYQDGYGRGLTITCVAPFYDADGEFMGCVAMDILMNDLNESMVSDGVLDPKKAVLFDSNGMYIAGKHVDPMATNPGNIYEGKINPELVPVADYILDKKDGMITSGEGADAMYVSFGMIDSTEWILCILSPVSDVIRPAMEIQENIDQNTESIISKIVRVILSVIQSCLVLSALILILVSLFAGKISKKISDPIKQLETDVRQISEGNLEIRTEVDTNDEIGSLAKSFNYMTDSLQKYIIDLKEVTAKEERIASELNVATRIQADMLPCKFPAFPDRDEFDIYASMTPAKEVGGDFYDFFLLDDDHLAVVMADVSGKGVPAALFMVISKTLIKDQAQMCMSPKTILEEVNNKLYENNAEGMFVTVWLGIMEISTGKILAANAGHEYPAMRGSDGNFELIKDKHGMIVGAMENLKYTEYEMQLEKGGCLFLYTDGVPEATNAENELFGTDRMITALNTDPDCPIDQLLKNVKASVDGFVGEAPQFDDLTMLALIRKT